MSSDFPLCRFYTKQQINNALQIKDQVGEDIDVFNLSPELPLRLEDFDGCTDKSSIKICFNQLVQKVGSVEALENSSFKQTYHEIKGIKA